MDEAVPDVLPRYVRLAEVVAGGRSALAVLVGGSSTGKTRACWEAVHGLDPRWRLWHPVTLDDLDRVGPHTVIGREPNRTASDAWGWDDLG